MCAQVCFSIVGLGKRFVSHDTAYCHQKIQQNYCIFCVFGCCMADKKADTASKKKGKHTYTKCKVLEDLILFVGFEQGSWVRSFIGSWCWAVSWIEKKWVYDFVFVPQCCTLHQCGVCVTFLLHSVWTEHGIFVVVVAFSTLITFIDGLRFVPIFLIAKGCLL